MTSAISTPRSRPLLRDRGVVAFAQVDWNGTWYSRHQILRRLASYARVIVVDPPAQARDVLARSIEVRPVLEQVAEQLWTYRPPRRLALLYRPRGLARVLERLRARHLERTAARLGLTAPLHYVWHPDYAPLLRDLRPRPTAYHRYDKFDAYQDAPAEQVRAHERELGTRAGLLLASSRSLTDDLAELTGKPARHFPHAVDFEFFDARARNDALPADLAPLPRPRVGYVARLDERIDDVALREIATGRPDWSVVIIGGAGFQSAEGRERFEALTSLPNVHALGARPRDAVPAYAAGLDVCLLCYRTDNWGRWVQPIKAYEYLACGRPIVSSPIAAAADFGPLVTVVPRAGEWVPTIERVLAGDGAEAREARRDYARANTWDERAAQLADLLEGLLAGAGPASSGATRQSVQAETIRS